MRKPSKLLSLFLAFVMVLTSLSVGLTAFAAPENWPGSITNQGADDITANIDAIAHALMDDDGNATAITNISGTNANGRNLYNNLTTVSDRSDYGITASRGAILFDNEYGNMVTAVTNAFEILSKAGTVGSSTGSELTYYISQWITSNLSSYMGAEDYAKISSNIVNYILSWFGPYNNTDACWPNGKGANRTSTYGTDSFVVLDEVYYLYNQYDGDINLLPNEIATVLRWSWTCRAASIVGTTNRTTYVGAINNKAVAVKTVTVAADALKAFNSLFEGYWADFKAETFDNIPNDVQLKILDNILENITDYYNNIVNSQGVDANATSKAFELWFGAPSELFGEGGASNPDGGHYQAFLNYLLQKFINAVNAIETDYFTDGKLNVGLTLDALRNLKSLIDATYGVYNGLPEVLKSSAEAYKEKLDAFYFNENDTATSSTSFVTAWNNASAQAYIDATEELEFASGKDYIIKNDAELERVKELLDAAKALYGDILQECPYEDATGTPDYSDLEMLSESLLFESKAGNIQGGAEVVEHAKSVWDGAYEAYCEYLYRKFVSIASANLDEYCKDTNGNGKIDEGDEIPDIKVNLLNLLVFRAQMQKVQAAYNVLTEDVKDRPLVKFYMSIVAKIEAGVNALEGKDWSRYDELEYPYYYNWDEKNKDDVSDADIQALLDALNALLGSEAVMNILGSDDYTPTSLADFVDHTINNLLAGPGANDVIQAVLTTVMPMIQTAMADASLPVGGSAMDAQRNGGQVINLGIAAVYIEVMRPDPNMLREQIALYTNNANTLEAARIIGLAGTNWDNVDWENVDWKLELADDPVDEFCNIVGGILKCIAKLVRALLFNEKAEADLRTTGLASALGGCLDGIDLTVSKWYNAGYDKDLLPFLELIGCENLVSTAQATQWADNDNWNTLVKQALVNPLLARVNDLVSGDVVGNILELLPNFAYLLQWDKLTGTSADLTGSSGDGGDGWTYKADKNGKSGYEADADFHGLNDLLSPLTRLAGLSLESLLGFSAIDGNFVNEMLAGISLGDTGIVLPEINWVKLQGLGEMDEHASSKRNSGERKYITGYPKEVILYFIDYLSEVITTNSDAIHDLIAGFLPEDNEKVAELFETLYGNLVETANDQQAFAAVLFELIRTVEGIGYDWADFNEWDWKQSLVNFAGLRYDKNYVNASIDKLSQLVNAALNTFVFKAEDGDDVSLTDFISSKDILTGDIINSLFKTIYSLDSEMIEMILSFIEIKDGSTKNGIDISLNHAIELLADYPEVVAVLEAWAADHPYIVDEVPSGEYEVTCKNKVEKEVEGEDGEVNTEEVDCNKTIVVTEPAGTIDACPECGNSITYTEEDVKVLTETVSMFGDEDAEDYEEVITADMWNVTDVESFKNALVTILDPFKYIVGAVLANDGTTISVAQLVNVVLDDGYANVIKPLLSVFENEANFKLDASVAADTALDQILTMLINLVDAIAADPVNIIISVLPQIAAFIDNGGIQNLVEYFIQPFWNVISAVFDLVQVDNDFVPTTNSNRIFGNSLFDIISDIMLDGKADLSWENFEDSICDVINIFLENIITIGDEKYSIVLPAIDWADLAGSGTKGANSIEADKASVVVKILRYIWRVVVTNEPTISAVLSDKVGEFWGKLNEYITLGGYEEDDFVYLVLTVINGLDSSDYDSTDIWEEILNAVYEPATNVKYPLDPNGKEYTPADVDELVKFLSALALNAVESFIDDFDFQQLGGTIYNSVVPALLASYVLPLFESAKEAFDLLGMSYSYDALLEALTAAGYADVADAIAAQGVTALADIDWSAVSDDNMFGITNSEEFTAAVSTILEPFMPFLDFILNAGTIVVLEVVPLIGSNGYANALLPLLQTLGIEAVDADTYKADAEADPKNLLADIIDPLCAWLNNILFITEDADGPVGALLSRLPEIAKFLDNGGLQQFIGDITYPFSNLINTILDILTNGKQDNIFNLAIVIGTEMAKEATGEKEDLFDKILALIFGDGTPEITWDNLHEHVFDLAAMILNIVDIGATAEVDKSGNLLLHISVNGTPMTIKIPKYDLAKLAGIDGTDKVKKTTDSLLVVLQYFWDGILNDKTTFKSVRALLVDIIGDNYFTNVADKTLGTYIENLLGAQINEIIAALIQTKDGLDSSDHVADWSFLFKNYKSTGYNYPKGVTSQDIEEVIEILTTAIENALELFFDTTLPSLATGVVYTNDIVDAVKGIVNSLAENDTIKSVFGLLGLDIEVNNTTYNVTDKASFAAALADILAPFEPLTDVLLNSGELTIVDLVTIKGADGFNNAVKPFLEYALGCTVKDSSFKGIITAVLDRVEEILADPINELIDALPLLANFIDKGGVQYFVEELIYPIINLTNPLVTLITKESVFDFALSLLGFDMTWANAQNDIFSVANSMLKNITINGKSYSITIPAIKWSKLAGCGKLVGKSIEANTSDVLMTVLDYIFRVLSANKNIVFDLVGDNATINQIINNILNQGAGGMAKILVNVLLKMETFDNVSWLFRNIKPVETTYTPNYGEEDYARFVGDIDEAIFGLLSSFVSNLNVATLLNDNVYKNSIVTTIAKAVYPNLENISVAGISIHKLLKAIDLDITTATVADMLSDFSSASAEIGSHDAWADVNFDAINWNFEDGDKDGFISALSAALRPIQPLIRVILSGEDLIVLGSITVKGGNGYNTVVIPLLEAIGVEPTSLVSPADYSAAADTDKVLTSVLTPVLDFAETLLDKPIYTLANMLPNVAYFLLNGGAQAIVENIGGPIFNILDEVAPIYDLNVDKLLKDAIGFGISDLGNLDLDGLVNTLLASIEINGQKLPIRITDIDLETLAGRGTLVEYTSARTYNGVRMEAKKVVADTPAVFISVLRYIVENLKANLDAIKELLAGLGLSGDIADMINMILGFLTDLDTDMVIEQLMELLFGAPDGDSTAGNAPYEVRDMAWLHWTIVGCATLFMLLIFLVVLGKKKKDEEPAEVAAQE